MTSGQRAEDEFSVVMREVEAMEQEIVLSPNEKGQIIRRYAKKARAEGGPRRAFLFVRIFNICNARDEMTDRDINLTISGGQFGVLNLGQVKGSIFANVQSLVAQGGEHEAVAQAITRLTETITNSGALSDSEKKEALDVVDSLSSQAKELQEKRSTSVLKTILTGFPALVSSAKDVVDVWDKVGPSIRNYFGL